MSIFRFVYGLFDSLSLLQINLYMFAKPFRFPFRLFSVVDLTPFTEDHFHSHSLSRHLLASFSMDSQPCPLAAFCSQYSNFHLKIINVHEHK